MTKLLFLPVIAAFIGWLTNLIAIRLLFRPYHPVKIPLLPFEIVGLIPKRHSEIAEKVGQVVEKELLSVEDIWRILNKDEARSRFIQAILLQVEKRIGDKVPFFLQGMKDTLFNSLSDLLNREIGIFFDEQMDELVGEMKQNISIARIVEEKINALSLREVEKIVLDVARQELKHIEILGGILGFIIGLLQVFLVVVF